MLVHGIGVGVNREVRSRHLGPVRGRGLGDSDDPDAVALGNRTEMHLAHPAGADQAQAKSGHDESFQAALGVISVGLGTGRRVAWAAITDWQSAISRRLSEPEVVGRAPVVTQWWKWMSSSLKPSR